MSNVNHTLTQSLISPVQASGTVTHSFADGSLTVESEGRGWHCRRAASCVIVPQAGDTVLIARVDNRIWILAVLEQLNPQASQLRVPGDLQIHSQGELSLSGASLRVSAEQGDCHIGEMKYSGDSLSAWVSLSRVVGKRAESVW